ncbi:MAG: ribonuclease H family protein [Bacteroidales bacterium]|nr:ribonuclease H family protein [Candidatus Colicola faecequi]
MSKNKNKYYVVWSGKEPGIYDSWEDCEKQVKGQEGAKFKGFPTHEEAEKAFASSPADYIVYGPKKTAAPQPQIDELPVSERPLFPAWAVDGACSGNPGMMEYRGVDAQTGAEIFHFGPVAGGTNNIAEYLAIVHVLALMKQWAERQPDMAETYLTMRVYSDSKTAQSWVKKRKCGSKLEQTEQNKELFNVIQRADNWLAVNTYRNPILKWQTEKWGEIPADFGRK